MGADRLLEQRLGWLEARGQAPPGCAGLRLRGAGALLQGVLLQADWEDEAARTSLAAAVAGWPCQRLLCLEGRDAGLFAGFWPAGASAVEQLLMERPADAPSPSTPPPAASVALRADGLGPLEEALGRLLVEAFPDADVPPARAGAWVRLLAPTGRARLVREDGGRPVGCLLETFEHGGWRLLEALAVRPSRRGRGLARALLEEACRAADADGRGLRLLVGAERPRLIGFYRSLGFRDAASYRLLEPAADGG